MKIQWSNVKWVFLREVRDQLRDRRTLFTIAVLPLLLYPLMGMSFLQIAQFSREHATRVLVVGADALPEQPELFEEDQFSSEFCSEKLARLLQLTIQDHGAGPSGPESAERLLRGGQYGAVVYFPPEFAARLRAFRQAILEQQRAAEPLAMDMALHKVPEPEIYVDTANEKSRIARDRVEQVLASWRASIVRQNLAESRVPVEATEPFDVVNRDVAKEQRKRAAVWSKVLPFVVLIWALTGAFYPAIDLCAGEKERGTLETLLCSPAQRSEIVWGKLLTIMLFSGATSVLNLVSMGVTGAFIVSRIGELGARPEIGTPPLMATIWILVALLPIAALFSALSLAVAAFARSSKEGQYYLMPLLLITLPLMILPMLPTAELDLGTSLIPVTGMMLLVRSLIEGSYLEALRFTIPVFGVTAICCMLAIRWAIDQFNDESVLFRESERWGLGLWIRHMVRDRRETPTMGEAFCCGVLLLMIRFFASFMVEMPAGWIDFARSTTVSLVAFIAAPALLMAVVLTRSPRKTLLLTMPKPMAIPMAVLLAVVLHPAGLALAEGIQELYPFSDEIQRQMAAMGDLITGAPALWAVLLVLAVVPAICEELAFRGFILSGLRHMGHRWAAIVVSAVFFGATHGILQQSLAACAVGIVIGYLAVQTGSLLPCILFHMVYNSMTLLLAMALPGWIAEYPALEWIYRSTAEGFTYHTPVLIIASLLAAGILGWFRCLPYEATPEESLQEALDHQAIVPLGERAGG